MSAVPGAIGAYAVNREIGRGGMGVVYLARDERLDRDVAIKALPEELASDPTRLERFEREAKTLAQLNHPNIAAIYGVEEQDGQKYLILEYVEGETLGERLDRGPLPVEEALEIAIEIAKGVEAAHEAGVIHRDLKPDNVKLTPEGKVKVLDFGLAKSADGATSTGAADPTLTTPRSPTIPGAILGTAPYMSPEQARGRKVDRRTDVWSFGVILYEMLTGACPFVGETVSDSLGAVLHKSIDFDRLPPEVPPGARHALWRCLQRSRDDRYADIGDVRVELQAAVNGEVAPWVSDSTAVRSRTGWIAALLVAVVVVTAGLVAGLAWRGADSAATRFPGAAHLTIDLGDEFDLVPGTTPFLAVDGRRVILNASWNEQAWVVVRDMDDPIARAIPNTRLGSAQAISPDGLWVCIQSDRMFRKAPISGGPSIPICTAPNARGGVWAEDGSIILSPNRVGPLHRVNEDGGEPVPMYEMAEAERWSDRTPALLPRAKGVLFDRTSDGASWDECSVMVVPLTGGQPHELVHGARFGRYLHTGHLIYQREDTLMAVGFDLDRLEVTTREVPVLRGLSAPISGGGGPPRFDLAANGTLVYWSGSSAQHERSLGTLSLEGEWTPLSSRTGNFGGVQASADGRFIAVETVDLPSNHWSISILELERDLLRPVTDASDSDMFGVAWHPDGQSIVCVRTWGEGGVALCRYRVGGAAEPEVLLESEQLLIPYDWTSDGRTLIASRTRDSGRNVDLVLLRFDEQGRLESAEPDVLIDWPGYKYRARFSHDDKWVLFASRNSQAGYQMYVAALDDPTRAVQVSVDGATLGCWAPNQDRIYYVKGGSARKTVFAVDFTVSNTGEFKPGVPKALFDLTGVDEIDSMPMTADGSAFIIARPVDGSDERQAPQLNVVINWAESIKGLLPASE